MKKKIFVFLGSRANYSSLKSIMTSINRSEIYELILTVGASALLDKYGEVVKLIEMDEFNINERLYMLIEGEKPETMAKSTGLGIIELSSILKKYSPNYTLIVGDRFEMLSAAIASAYINIPIIHTMGGEISGSIDESIRHAITKLSHVHFPSNKLAEKRILQMGENKNTVFNVGCPRIDTIKEILKEECKTGELNKYISKIGVGDIFKLNRKFLMVSQHPVTTEFNQGKEQILQTLEAVKEVSDTLDIPVIMLWPNADAGSDDVASGIRIFRERGLDRNFHFFKNLPIEYYVRLMDKTSCLIGNSSSGIREGSYIGTPVVNIGTRQDGRMRGINVIDTKYEKNEIKKAIYKQLDHGKYKSEDIYGTGNAGEKIVKILENIQINIQKKFINRF
ncbi:MAG: UDP-N-acetylglucosamine 2-epimerase (hydrolyzing) [Candidatus Lokiarchaeota archaeon]|nr:UDP-N-acetylglucosamine 2-epimerase (hydrolyzing) [Candidatus Lokiarchaeota archaeon]